MKDFEELFSVFPSKRKGTRRMALPAWNKAIQRECPEVIVAAAKAYAASEPGEYAKGLPAWLNGDCWAIEYTPAKPRLDRDVYKTYQARLKKPYHDFMSPEELKKARDYCKAYEGQ